MDDWSDRKDQPISLNVTKIKLLNVYHILLGLLIMIRPYQHNRMRNVSRKR